jgi:hypothetical protein
MISSVSPNRVRTSVGIKIASLSVLTVLAVAFFVFPLVSLAAASNVNANVKLVGVIQSGQAFGARVAKLNGTARVDTSVKASQLKAGSFFVFETNNSHVGLGIAIGPGEGVIEGTTNIVSVK